MSVISPIPSVKHTFNVGTETPDISKNLGLNNNENGICDIKAVIRIEIRYFILFFVCTKPSTSKKQYRGKATLPIIRIPSNVSASKGTTIESNKYTIAR